EHFKGLMPLEIVVDTRKQKGALRLSNLQQVEKFEELLAESEYISKPLSIIGLVKASRQAFYNNQSEFYELPNRRDQPFIFRYLQDGQDSTSNQLLSALVDSSGQKIRISLKVADVGSIKLDSLINQVIEPKVKEAFDEKRLDVNITGITRIFLKGNDYLVTSIRNSLLLAIALISILMAFLFSSFRIILITIITNILPLLITAGLMGFWGISLKPSTALIFSIAFGIAIDDSIHFLARFRQAINLDRQSVPDAIAVSLKETGTGMVYTSIILFCGFIIFLYSEFDGTKALGYLTATTLFCAMFGNLMLLPSLLMDFEKTPKRNQKDRDGAKNTSNGALDKKPSNGLKQEYKWGDELEG
ncbi:MAG: efflux RND transporter permease subunit, partial [Bacteroidota bacterium]